MNMLRSRWNVVEWTVAARRLRSTLAYEEIASIPSEAHERKEATRVLVIHGLLGARRNWRSITKNLATKMAEESRRSCVFMLADLRNHGTGLDRSLCLYRQVIPAHDSTDFDPRLSRPWPSVVTGHSLGGKVALEYVRLLQQDPQAENKLPKQVWILDSQVGPVTSSLPANQQVDRILELVQSIQTPIPSRKWLYAHVRRESGLDLKVAHWLGSNLNGHPNGPLNWMFNVQGAIEMYASYKKSSCWDVVTNPPRETQIHIVRADASERWNRELIHELHTTIKATQGQTRVHVLENAGHWLHADNPEGLVKLIMPRLMETIQT